MSTALDLDNMTIAEKYGWLERAVETNDAGMYGVIVDNLLIYPDNEKLYIEYVLEKRKREGHSAPRQMRFRVKDFSFVIDSPITARRILDKGKSTRDIIATLALAGYEGDSNFLDYSKLLEFRNLVRTAAKVYL